MTQVLGPIATHALALLVYPGLPVLALFGFVVEALWSRIAGGSQVMPRPRLARPQIVLVAVALLAVLAAVQVAAPFNPVPPGERNVIIAAVAIGFTAWAELALDPELVGRPGLLLVIQAAWLLSVLGPAIEPESLRPQVLGNVLVPGLLPVKVACGFLYLLCLPALLRLWPVAPPADRRARPRFNATRALVWFPYCALFATLFFPPQGDDVTGLVRFFGLTTGVAALCLIAASLLARRGAERARGLYTRAVAPYSVLVLALIVVTLILMR
jgi:NADH:ubiquinone oxidoreductase subunit 6 (subunit J)